eukprot:342730-Pleurochrysis_carterae.AAC.2
MGLVDKESGGDDGARRECNAFSALSCSFASAMVKELRRCSSSTSSGARVAGVIAASLMVGCSPAGKSRLELDDPAAWAAA